MVLEQRRPQESQTEVGRIGSGDTDHKTMAFIKTQMGLRAHVRGPTAGEIPGPWSHFLGNRLLWAMRKTRNLGLTVNREPLEQGASSQVTDQFTELRHGGQETPQSKDLQSKAAKI